MGDEQEHQFRTAKSSVFQDKEAWELIKGSRHKGPQDEWKWGWRFAVTRSGWQFAVGSLGCRSESGSPRPVCASQALCVFGGHGGGKPTTEDICVLALKPFRGHVEFEWFTGQAGWSRSGHDVWMGCSRSGCDVWVAASRMRETCPPPPKMCLFLLLGEIGGHAVWLLHKSPNNLQGQQCKLLSLSPANRHLPCEVPSSGGVGVVSPGDSDPSFLLAELGSSAPLQPLACPQGSR